MTPDNFTKLNKQNKMPKDVQMVVYKNGHIKIIDVKSLNEKSFWNLSGLQGGEEITCGSFSPHCHNFVLGTSHGAIYIGNYVKEGQEQASFDIRGKKATGGVPSY